MDFKEKNKNNQKNGRNITSMLYRTSPTEAGFDYLKIIFMSKVCGEEFSIPSAQKLHVAHNTHPLVCPPLPPG